MIESYSELRQQLAFYAEDDYRIFIMKGIPSDRPFIGVRIPILRQIVSQINPAKYDDFLKITPMAFEEVIVRGMIICRLPYLKILENIDSQIGYIDDWCACDTFCSELSKTIKKHKTDFFDQKLNQLLEEKDEFAVRSGLVLLKCAYIEPGYINVIFDKVESLATREEYYIRMGLAWLVAECFIKFPDETLSYLKVSHLPAWTFNKTISKICDSYRVEKDVKDILKSLRK